MKTLLKLSFVLLLIGFTNTGCEKIKDLADVTFDADFTATMDATVEPTSLKSGQAMGYFDEFTTIDPNTNSDFKTYASKIKEIKVEKVIVEVISITGSANNSVVVDWAHLHCHQLPSFDENGFFAFFEMNNETLTVGKTFEFTAAGELGDLETILNTKESFDVYLHGAADPVNATIGFKVYINSKITANALN